MVKRTVETELRAKVDNYTSGMEKAKAATEDLAASQTKASESTDKLGGKAASQSDSWKTVSTGLLGAGAAAAAFGLALPTKAASDFEAAMAQVSSTGPEARAGLSELAVAARKSAVDIDGAGYSAVQAAGGIEALIKAGVSVEDVMGGAMAGALTLAAAGQMDVAAAAEAASSAMVQFKLEGKDVPHIADLLAAGAGKAQGDVSDFTMALSQSGLVASQFGLSIEDTVGTLSAFASAGLLGSDAGTSFRSMLLRLANPAGEAADEMARLGISAYDTQGNFVGVTSLAGQLQNKLGGLDQATRDAALATIFGNDAIRAANVLYEQGADGISDWIEKVDDSGFAAEMAREKMNSLQGDLQKLWAVLGEVGIAAGEGNLGLLREFTQTITQLLRVAAQNPETLQVVAIGIGAVGVAAAALGLTMKVVTAVSEFREAVVKLDGASRKTGDGIDEANKATGRWSRSLRAVAGIAAAGGLLVFLGNLRNSLLATKTGTEEAEAAMERFARGTGGLDKIFTRQDGSGVFESVAGSVDDLESALRTLADGTPQFTAKYRAVAEQFGLIDEELKNMDPEMAAAAFRGLREQAEELGVPLDVLLGQLDGYKAKADAAAAANGLGELSFQQLVSMLSGGIPTVDAAGEAAKGAAYQTELLAAAEDKAAASAQAHAAQVEALAGGDGAFVDLMGAYDTTIQKNQEMAQATADSTKDSSDSWEDYIEDHGFSLDAYLANLAEMVAAQEAWESNMLILSGRVSEGLLTHLASLGPEGAPLVAALVDGTEAQLQQMEEDFAQSGEAATTNFANELIDARPIWAAVAAKAGDAAMVAAQKEVASGQTTLQNIINRFDLKIKIGVDKTGYWDAMNTLNSIAGKTVTTYVAIKKYGQGAIATGGYGGDVAAAMGLRSGGNPWVEARRYSGLVEGPGTPTSDSIHAMISRKEFVTNAEATSWYGTPVMYAMNRKQIPRELFAQYGFAGGGTPAAAAPARLALTPAANGAAGSVVNRHYNVTVPKDAFRSWNAFESFLANIDHHAELAGGPR